MLMREIMNAVESEQAALPSDITDVAGNWRRFDDLPATARVLLYHATSETAAQAIVNHGFRQDSKVWANSVGGYVYLGGSARSIEMYGLYAAQRAGGGERHVILTVAVRKSDLLPDDGKDWTYHCKDKGNRAFVAQWFGKDAVRYPTVTATFGCIGQVRAPVGKVEPIGILDTNNLGW